MDNMTIKQDNKPSNKIDLPDSQSGNLRSTSKNRSDLACLFGSETRAFVIWTLLNHPDRGLTQAEIARLADRDPKDVQRALDILVSLSLVWCVPEPGGEPRAISRYASNDSEDPNKAADQDIENRIRTFGLSKRYWLNKKHPFVPGLRMILERSKLGVINLIQQELRAFPVEKKKPYIAFIFGSFAVGEQTPESDIDLIVIGYHDRETLAEIIDNLEERIARNINYIEYSREEWASALEDDADFARSIMSNPRIFLIGDNERLEKISTKRTSG